MNENEYAQEEDEKNNRYKNSNNNNNNYNINNSLKSQNIRSSSSRRNILIVTPVNRGTGCPKDMVASTGMYLHVRDGLRCFYFATLISMACFTLTISTSLCFPPFSPSSVHAIFFSDVNFILPEVKDTMFSDNP